jgi:hypothetical protein
LQKIIDLHIHYAIEGIAGFVIFGTNLKFLAYKAYRGIKIKLIAWQG